MHLRSLALALALGATSASAQSVLVVDQAGGAGSQFTALQPAIDAAASGDIVLIRSGSYATGPFGGGPPFLIDGKGLTLVEDAGASVTIGTLDVRNLAPPASVTVRGFDFVQGNGLVLANNSGPVFIEDCHFDFNINGSPVAIDISACQAVHVNRCSSTCSNLVAGPGIVTGNVRMLDSNVQMIDCSFDACDANPFAPSAMNGAIQDGGYLFL